MLGSPHSRRSHNMLKGSLREHACRSEAAKESVKTVDVVLLPGWGSPGFNT